MKKYAIYATFAGILLFAFSCAKKADTAGNIVTQRIQYDVSIVSPDTEFDWWVQNIEGANRESMVQDIIGAVSQGKVKAYDFVSNKLLSAKDVNHLLKRTDTIALERAEPPHELVDTVLVHEVALKDITRIRFLEEWQMDRKTLAFSKKVAGICPLVQVFAENGELKGYKPLFWIFFDEQYPGKFLLNK